MTLSCSGYGSCAGCLNSNGVRFDDRLVKETEDYLHNHLHLMCWPGPGGRGGGGRGDTR